MQAAAARPDLVQAVAAVETSGFGGRLDPARQHLLSVLGGLWHDAAVAGRRTAVLHFAAGFAGEGGRSDVLDTDARGWLGHTHMPMMDTGSDVLATEILDWLLNGVR